MASFKQVVWGEGMFLHPQHFQQSERAAKYDFKEVFQKNLPYCWGVLDIKVKDELLKENIFALESLKCLFPDVTLVSFPERDSLLEPLTIEDSVSNLLIHVVVPIDNNSGKEITHNSEGIPTRYRAMECSVVDNVSGTQEEILQTKELRISLVLGSDIPAGYVALPIARLQEAGKERGIVLDPDYIPPCLATETSGRLQSYISNILAMTKIRADAIAQRLGIGKSASPSVMDFVMLQMLNRNEATLRNMLQSSTVHPYEIYSKLVEYIGEMSTFTSKSKRCPELQNYRHESLSELFEDVNQVITHQLSVVLEQTALKLKLEPRAMGIQVAPLPNKSVLTKGQIILAIKADCSAEELAQRIPSHVKIGPVEYIRDLVVSQIAGVQVKVMPMVPRQIPYEVGTIYFELIKQGKAWEGLANSSGIALHIAGDYSNLKSDLWCISK